MYNPKIIKVDAGNLKPLEEDYQSLIFNTLNSISNLFYELIVAVDIVTSKVIYASYATKLAQQLASYNFRERSFSYLVETLSDLPSIELDKYYRQIKAFYKITPDDQKTHLTFLADFPFLLNGSKNWATYKLSPLTEDSAGNLLSFVASISFSAGNLVNQLLAVNNKTMIRKCYNFEDSTWEDYKIPDLTPIELSVLALSAQGLSVNEIAPVLCKAVDTIKSARKRIFQKLNVSNITKAIVFATNNKII